MPPATLHFPGQGAIVAYLEKHPLTSDRYLREKKIIDTVAAFFADQDLYPIGVDTGVMTAMMELNEKLGLPEIGLMTINFSLTMALIDCAAGKANVIFCSLFPRSVFSE